MTWNTRKLGRARTSKRYQPSRRRFRLQLERLETRLAPANVPILSGHYDNLLTGWNNQEEALTPAKVNDPGFGKLFNYSLDGYAYAQPLYVPKGMYDNVHNVVFVATEHDTLFAFDGDNPNPNTGGGKLWERSFLTPRPGFTVTTMPSGETFSGDIVPEIGITGTPVIDGATKTIYLDAKTKEVEDGTNVAHYIQRLYAVDITTGQDKVTPFTIGDTTGDNNNTSTISVPGTGVGSVNGILTFNARKENDRMSLQLVTNQDASKTVYEAWASHGDNGPYHGWVVGFSATTLAVQKIYNTSPNGSASGIWESGGNLGVDAQNNLYFSTGNGFGDGFNTHKGGPTTLGGGGGDLGYAGNDATKIKNSVSVRFRNFPTQTGLGTNGNFGANVSMPDFDFNASAQASPFHTFSVTLAYNASTKALSEMIVNNNVPAQTFSTSYNIDIPATVGGNLAHVGFTGATGGLNAEQDITKWTFGPTGGPPTIDHSAGFSSAGDLTANGGASLPPYTAASPVGSFQYHQDLGIPGDPVPPGTASYNAGTQTYTLTASGTDIGFKANQYDTDTDRMQFVYNAVSGTNGEILARVNSLTNTDFWTKAVVQIRQTLDAQSPNVQSVMSAHDQSEITWRNNPPAIDNLGNTAPGLTGATERPMGTGPKPGWIRLVRSGNIFISYWAVDNNGTPGPWQGELSHATTMNGDVYVGLGLSAHANGKTATVTFDHVSVTGFTARTIDPVAILTPATNDQRGSIFSNNKVDISTNFTTTFTFQMRAGSSTIADGMTFTIQNATPGTEISESVLKISTTDPGTIMPLKDYFTPHDWKLLDNQDADLGSGGTLLLPSAVSGGKNLIVETGKTGRLYLINRDNMGKFNTRYDRIEQIVTLAGPNQTPGVWGNPAFLQDGPNTGLLFYWGSSSPGQAFRITNGVIDPVPASKTAVSFGFPGSQPSISSNGTDGNTAIMWALRVDNYGSTGPETLYAYKAEDLGAAPLWISTDVTGRDAIGGSSVKFTFPIVTNGHVYAQSNGSLAVYGLLPVPVAAPTAPTVLAAAAASSPPWASLTWRWARARNSGANRASGPPKICW